MHGSVFKQMMIMFVSVTTTIATNPEQLAEAGKFSINLITDLLNTDDYSNIDIAAYSSLLGQQAETLEQWHDSSRVSVLKGMRKEVELICNINPPRNQTEDQTITATDRWFRPRSVRDRALVARVNEEAEYRGWGDSLLSLHRARINSERSNCLSNTACGWCVAAAGFALTSGVSACVEVAIEAEILTAEPTFGVSTAPIWIGLLTCTSAALSVFSGAVGICVNGL